MGRPRSAGLRHVQYRADYTAKRDLIVSGLQGHFEFASPGGAFYVFPKAPWGTGTEFVRTAIENELLIIPGNIFSEQDTHFRISFAASMQRSIAESKSFSGWRE